MLVPYAMVTARNVVATIWRYVNRRQRNQQKVADVPAPVEADESVLVAEEKAAITRARPVA